MGPTYHPVHQAERAPGGYPRPYEPASPRPVRSLAPHPHPPLAAPEALGADEELVAGRRPVEEAFVAGRPARRLLVTPARRQALERIVLHATRLRIPIVEVEGGTLTAMAGFDGHQGVALVVEPRRFAIPQEILARAAEKGEPPFILVVDSLEDPQNLGTLLRSAEAAGVHGVLFPTDRQAPLTPAAVKASAGAVEHLLLAPVDDLAGALADLHVRGLRVVGSDAEAPLTARQSDLRGPLALVVGSEGRGLGAGVRRRCDLLVRIPMRGAVGSLNAAVAGSVLLFEAVAQRDPEGRSAPPRQLPDEDAEPAEAPPGRAADPALAAPPGAADAALVAPDDGAGAALTAEPDPATAPRPDATTAPAHPPETGEGPPRNEAALDAVEAVSRPESATEQSALPRDAATKPGSPRASRSRVTSPPKRRSPPRGGAGQAGASDDEGLLPGGSGVDREGA